MGAGHIHQREILNEVPHIIFPGNLQGRHIGEQGSKGAALVSVKDGSVAGIDWVYPDVVRWVQVEMDLTSCKNREEALSIFEETMQDVVENEADGRMLAVRCHLISPQNSTILFFITRLNFVRNYSLWQWEIMERLCGLKK